MMSPRTVVEKGSMSVPLDWSTTAFQAYEKDLWDSFDANVARLQVCDDELVDRSRSCVPRIGRLA